MKVPAEAVVITSRLAAFGGLSGIELSDDSKYLIALSDRAWVVRLDKRPPHRVASLMPLGGTDNAPSAFKDVESLRRAPDGGWWVAFEGVNRVAWYRPGWKGLAYPPKRQLLQGAFRGLVGNRGIETVATLPYGRGLALAEQSGDAQAIVFDPDGKVLARKHFRTEYPPVDAVALADGGLLILTRAPIWPLPPTFVTELVYVAPGWEAEEIFSGRPLFRLDHALPGENYEGMAVEPLGGDMLRIWLVSDDNYSALQDTILVQMALPLACLDASVHCNPARVKALPPRAPAPRSRPSPPPG